MHLNSDVAWPRQSLGAPDYLPRTAPARNVQSVPLSGPVFSVTMSGSGTHIAAGTADGSIVHIETWPFTYSVRPVAENQEVWSISTGSSGELMVIGTARKKPAGGTIFIFSGDQLIYSEELPAPVWNVDVLGDGTLIAVGDWSGQIHCYSCADGSTVTRVGDAIPVPGGRPVYGIIALTEDSVAANVYDLGTIRIGLRDRSMRSFPLSAGVYSLAAAGDRFLYAAMSNGSVAKIDLGTDTVTEIPVSTRPVYGIAVTPDNAMMTVGGTDGNVYALTTSGVELWRQRFGAEVWSVAMTDDAHRVIAGVADGSVQLIEDPCGADGAVAVDELCRAIGEASPGPAVTLLRKVPWISEAFDVPRAGVALLARAGQHGPARDAEIVSAAQALAALASRPADLLPIGEELLALEQNETALVCFQKASGDPSVRSASLILAAEALKAMGLASAASACGERAGSMLYDAQVVHLLYELGRNYESAGGPRYAAQIYEYLATWDATYRDCLERALRLRSTAMATDPELVAGNFEFPLLGADVPRPLEVDARIRHVVEARAMEVNLPASARRRSVEMLRRMADLGRLADTKQESLLYGLPDYLRYEYCTIEDSAKKHLEMLALSSQVPIDQIRRSLDIGTATCRYPRYFKDLGISSVGVDIKADGYIHARSTGADFRNFIQGDGLDLPFTAAQFDLVTCMMGTFDHIPGAHRQRLVDEMVRCLVPGGWMVLGVWDIECEFQGFLSIYSQVERAQLRQLSASRREIAIALEQAGVSDVSETPVMCMPDTFLREMMITRLDERSMGLLVEIELAMRSRFRDPAAQMTVICGRKAF